MGLLDLVDLVVNVQQSVQLKTTREQLQRMEVGARQEAERQSSIEALRQVAFTLEQNMRALDQVATTHPQPVYATTLALEHHLHTRGITPDAFSTFADKTYVQQLYDHLREVKHQTQHTLSADQCTQAEDCAQAMLELPHVEQAIHLRALQSTVEDMKATLHQHKRRQTAFFIGGLGIMVGSFTALVISPYLVFLLCLLGGFLIYRSNRLSGPTQHTYDTLQDELTHGQVILQQFANTQDLVQYKHERHTVVQAVMGQLDGYERVLPASVTPS